MAAATRDIRLGTGVITLGQLLGVAAHLEGRGIVTQDAAGLAQKGGATWSHVLLADTQDAIRTTRVGAGAADLVLGCDPVVAAGKETLVRMRPGRTHVALNTHTAPTAAFAPQALHTLKTRDVSGISLAMYLSFTVGVALWLVYGLLRGDWPIIIGNTITLGLALVILALKLRYGRHR